MQLHLLQKSPTIMQSDVVRAKCEHPRCLLAPVADHKLDMCRFLNIVVALTRHACDDFSRSSIRGRLPCRELICRRSDLQAQLAGRRILCCRPLFRQRMQGIPRMPCA